MTPNYFNHSSEEIPLVTDFQGMEETCMEESSMSEPKPTLPSRPTLRSHLKGIKRAGASVLRLRSDKRKTTITGLGIAKTGITEDVAKQGPTPGVDISDLIVEAGPLRAARIDVQGEVIMRTGKSLLGLTVVSHVGGAVLGQVQDLIFSPETDEALAMVLGEKDLFGLIEAQIVPWGEILSVGKDVIIVNSQTSKMKLHDYPRALQATQGRETILSGTQVLTSDGKHLGTLADMCIDEATGLVKGYEISGGFIADTLHGKKFLPAPPTLTVGHDAAIAPPEAAAIINSK